MATPGRRAFALGLYSTPLSGGRIEIPEIIVVVEGALLGRREFSCTKARLAGSRTAFPKAIGTVLASE